MTLLQKIRNGTTTEEDAITVEAIMSAKADKTLEIMKLKKTSRIQGIALLVTGVALLAFALSQLFF